MTKQEHINYWLLSAEKEKILIDNVFNSGDYVYSLFFCHLYLEKLCKALWVFSNSDNIPPRTHNLMYLLNATAIELTEADAIFFTEMNAWQLEGRYPDYKFAIYKLCTKQFTQPIVEQTKYYAQWLHNKMQ